MSKTLNGTVVGKDFRPPDGRPPESWCYLVVDVSGDELVTIRLHRSKLDVARLGDTVVFTRPRRPDKPVRALSRVKSGPATLPEQTGTG